MGKREVNILDTAAASIAKIFLYVEAQGLSETAKRFVDEVFAFFETLSGDQVLHRPCTYKRWKYLNYRCVTYKKKYVIAYLSHNDEIVICDFVPYKILKD